MKQTVLLLVTAVLATLLPRSARADDRWDRGDWLYGGLSAVGGGTLGAVSGAAAGSLLDRPCRPDETSCFKAFTIAGAGAGLIIGSAYGVTLYGRMRGLHGSATKALLGAILGNVASGAAMVVAARVIDNGAIGIPVAVGVLVGFPAVGATIAYKRSVKSAEPATAPPRPAVPLALVEHTPGGGVALGIPAVTFAAIGDDVAVHVSLAAGRF